jgi:hypothetical protein
VCWLSTRVGGCRRTRRKRSAGKGLNLPRVVMHQRRRDRERTRAGGGEELADRQGGALLQGLRVGDAQQLEPPAPRRGAGRSVSRSSRRRPVGEHRRTDIVGRIDVDAGRHHRHPDDAVEAFFEACLSGLRQPYRVGRTPPQAAAQRRSAVSVMCTAPTFPGAWTLRGTIDYPEAYPQRFTPSFMRGHDFS